MTCTDTGLTSGTQFFYTIKARVGTSWIGPANAAFSGTTSAAFAITSHAQSGNKFTFSGVGSSGSTTITVVVCSANAFPCSAPNTVVASVNKTSPGVGAWGPTTQTGNLSNNATFYAQATQGASTSVVYTFTN